MPTRLHRYRNVIFYVFFSILCGFVIGGDIKEEKKGFTLFSFLDTEVISVQCNCHQLPEDINRVSSIILKLHLSTSESMIVASLYPYGK